MLDDAVWFSDDWTLTEDQLRVTNDATGVLFTTSNGYLGARGCQREPFGDGGLVLLAGCHETRPYAHPERSFAIAERYQTIVPVTDPCGVSITVDGVALTPASGTWLGHVRALDLRTGCVTTSGRWSSPAGPTVAVRTRRIASLVRPGMLWTSIELDAPDDRVEIEVALTVTANESDRTFPDEPDALSRAWGRVFRPAGVLRDGSQAGLVHTTALSNIAVACVTDVTATASPHDVTIDAARVQRTFRVTLAPGQPFSVTQRAAFADGSGDDPNAVVAAAAALASDGADGRFDDALAGNREVLDDFWDTADVELDGATDIARAVRFSTYQVFQATVGNPERASSAKGLTGQGYEGHHLWDQEIYVGQVLGALAPDAARRALSFRCRTLPQARARAAQLSHDGAQYPWRTIDGTEASSFFPAGAAQHHLNADIAWAIEHYVASTGDDTLLADGGRDVIVETARLWMSLGRFDDGGAFRLDGVTGPDEYTALVDNNLFTNLMAAANLRAAADRLEAAGDGADADEVRTWRRAADAVVVPYDEELGVHGQDETFLRRERWDLAGTPADQFPLQDHHHLLTLYRRQVLKQADVVLALWLLHLEFEPEQRRRDFDYYEPLTTHDSSLSAPVHAIVAADVGHLDLAWRYTRDVAFTDLESSQGNLADGIHLAAAAGSWLAIACGFGGFRVRDGRAAFRPQRPPGVDRLCFGLRFRGSRLEVATDGDGTTYRLLAGEALTLLHGDEPVALEPGAAVHRPPDVS